MINFMKTLLNKYRGLFLAFLVLGLLVVMVPLALGINDSTSGWKIDPGQVRTITSSQINIQLTVANTSTIAYFVPSKTSSELLAFKDKHPLGVRVGYCGDKNCDSLIGETTCNGSGGVGTCPSDCGICNNVPGLVTTSSPWSVSLTGAGALCGDGRCDIGLGEGTSTCAYDCGTVNASSKGCCAVKNASASNSNIFTNCSLYSVTATTTNFGSTPCNFQPACLSYYNSYPDYWGVCGKNPDYPCNTYSAAECPNHPVCHVSGSSCLKNKDCADYTDSSSCGGNSDCIWIGQADSPYCYGYCNTPVTPSPPDIPYYTYQNCIVNTNNWLGNVYSQSASIDSYVCGMGKRDVAVGTNCNGVNCYENYRGSCGTGSKYQDTVRNCPLNCGSIDSTTGKAKATADGCGDGICATSERKGGSNYCYVDCGDIGDGDCLAFSNACPNYISSPTDCDATHVCAYSEDSCDVTGAAAPYLAGDATCAKAKNRNECNRIGCYWNVVNAPTCGNGVLDSGETDITCPVDFYNVNNRGYYCQGATTTCAGKASAVSCGAITGCQWLKAGAYTN